MFWSLIDNIEIWFYRFNKLMEGSFNIDLLDVHWSQKSSSYGVLTHDTVTALPEGVLSRMSVWELQHVSGIGWPVCNTFACLFSFFFFLFKRKWVDNYHLRMLPSVPPFHGLLNSESFLLTEGTREARTAERLLAWTKSKAAVLSWLTGRGQRRRC